MKMKKKTCMNQIVFPYLSVQQTRCLMFPYRYIIDDSKVELNNGDSQVQ